MAELRTALDKEGAARGRHLLLTFAAGASSNFLEHTEMDVVQASVDYVNLMTYDFREAEWEPQAGHHSNLYTHPDDRIACPRTGRARVPGRGRARAASSSWGVPFYGRAWGSRSSGETGSIAGPRPPERIQTRYGNLAALATQPGWVRTWDALAQARSSGTRSDASSCGFDDPESCASSRATSASTASRARCSGKYSSDPTGALLGALYDGLRGGGATP
jgi:chitinase